MQTAEHAAARPEAGARLGSTEMERREQRRDDRDSSSQQEREEERYDQPHPDDVAPQRAGDDAGSQQEIEEKQPLRHASPLLTHAGTVGGLIFFTIWGVLGRLGLTALGTYNASPVFALIWPQVIGCAVMGALVENKQELENFIPFYVSLTTGFCGSMTTFSSFSLQVFQGFSNQDSVDRGGFYYAVDGLSQTAITFGMMTAGLRFGTHTSELYMRTLSLGRYSLASRRRNLRSARKSGSLRQPSQPHLLLFALLALGFSFWTGSAFLAGFGPDFWRGRATFAIVFGPFGTLLRWYLSRLNPRVKSFPFGTFAANMIATALIGIFVLLQSHSASRDSTLSCAVLQGLDDGFNGSLSTISTFAIELRTLKRTHAYRYAIVSWACGQLLLVLLYGVPIWVRSVRSWETRLDQTQVTGKRPLCTL